MYIFAIIKIESIILIAARVGYVFLWHEGTRVEGSPNEKQSVLLRPWSPAVTIKVLSKLPTLWKPDVRGYLDRSSYKT